MTGEKETVKVEPLARNHNWYGSKNKGKTLSKNNNVNRVIKRRKHQSNLTNKERIPVISKIKTNSHKKKKLKTISLIRLITVKSLKEVPTPGNNTFSTKLTTNPSKKMYSCIKLIVIKMRHNKIISTNWDQYTVLTKITRNRKHQSKMKHKVKRTVNQLQLINSNVNRVSMEDNALKETKQGKLSKD